MIESFKDGVEILFTPFVKKGREYLWIKRRFTKI